MWKTRYSFTSAGTTPNDSLWRSISGDSRTDCTCRIGRATAGCSCPRPRIRRRSKAAPSCYGRMRLSCSRPGGTKQRRDDRLRIAMLAPISWRTPPRHYGPWEQVTSLLTEALVARGVNVTLCVTLHSRTAGRLDGICPAPYSEDPAIEAKVWEMLHVAHVFEHAGEFDLIHNQADFVPLAFSRLVETPMVTTIHGFSPERILPAFKRYETRVHYVAISNADRHSDLRYA